LDEQPLVNTLILETIQAIYWFNLILSFFFLCSLNFFYPIVLLKSRTA
jgi:hypothetical protein